MKGEYVVQNASGSVLGRILIQLAKHRKIKTVNIVRRNAQVDEILALGADIVISTEGKTLEQAAEEIKIAVGGKLPYGGVDAVAGEGTELLTKVVRNNGTILVYGVMDGMKVE